MVYTAIRRLISWWKVVLMVPVLQQELLLNKCNVSVVPIKRI